MRMYDVFQVHEKLQKQGLLYELRTIRKWFTIGKIEGIKEGKSWKVTEEKLNEFLEKEFGVPLMRPINLNEYYSGVLKIVALRVMEIHETSPQESIDIANKLIQDLEQGIADRGVVN
ncbi:DNA-binding protein [Bacillus cereus]|uniref:DNA-binding protein n=1 Tax=Bacillus thuringiensis TaxID=1428 RepID=UPI000A38F153|nr:DNA-binding protein [Bacillus thuringiensis]MDA2153069.1 DNA-binding protein [Bacillus cereus]MDA2561849.1 DNA-binding protein [Bacillus cereus]MDA2615981.1 DNA-binding protein [Bacillus cereus]MEB9163941.1 DNA-binding protein [Bacillus cereus]MEB9512800.1 DNA-binding protein [Bacillus cereus]